MKPVLFESDSTNFDNNGICVLYDAASCNVTEEYNGAFDMELEYPTDGEWVDYIIEGRIILAKPNDVDDPHAFRIYEVQKDLDQGTIFARATSITDDLAGNLITYASVDNGTVQQAFLAIKNNLLEPTMFDFVSDIQTRSTSAWTRINPLQAIVGTDGSLVDLWGGDVKRTNNTVYLYSRRGQDHVTVIRPGKNIDGFNMVTSLKGIITKILPYYTYTPEAMPEYEMVQDNNGNWVKQSKYSSTTSVQPNPVTVTGDVVVSDKAGNYPVTYYSPVDYSNNKNVSDQVKAYVDDYKQQVNDSPTIIDTSGFDNQLQDYIYGLLNDEAKGYFIYNNPGCDEPSVSIKVDMIEIADSPEWELYKNLESIQITDTVDVYVKKFNVDVEVTIQSIVYDSLGERVVSITAGSAKNNLVQSITKTYDDKTKELQNYIDTVENGVYNSISRTADGQSKKFVGYTEPPADISTKGDLWFKMLGDGTVESYMFNGATWTPLVSQATIQAMDQAITDAKGVADSAASQAQSTADNINAVVTNNGYTTLDDLIASKVANDDYGTLFAQNAKSIGLFYDEGGVTKAMILLNNGTPYIKGDNIVLDGNTIVDGTFTVTDTMLAGDAVIKKLTASGIDAKDVTIINLDANNITGGDLELSHGLRITHNGVPVLEVDATTGQVKITAPNLATQDDLNNIELTPGPQGPQGLQGPAGTNSYTHIAWANSSDGVTGFSTTDSTSKAYIGMYVDSNATASNTPSTYKWTLIKGSDGTQGVQGPAGANGQTPYFHVAYATNATGTTGFSISDPTNKSYMGTYTDYTSADSTDPSKYKWVLIQGQQGPQGLQGLQGPQGDQGIKGADGTSSYTHIAYATNSTGTTGFSVGNSTGATYIGMYVDSVATDSTDPTKYKWTLIKGADGTQGIQGPAGANGQTPYLHIAYATNATGTTGFDTVDATGKTYIGTYTDFTAADSTDPTKYTWMLMKGADGVNGTNGTNGKGVSSVTEYYLATSASSGVTTATTGWTTTTQTVTATNKYLWNYEKVTYTDGSTTTTTPVAIGVYGDTGKGISSITEYYLASSASTGVTTATTGWTTTMQSLTTTNKYLWNYEKVTYTDSSVVNTMPVIIGVYGDTGQQGPQGPQGIQGIQGPAGSNGTSQFVYIRYSANADGSGMTTTPQTDTKYVGLVNTTSATAPATNTSYTWSLFKGADGNQGIQGPAGANGQTTYTWVKYADDEYGGNMTDTPAGKRYIGLAFNKTVATETTNASDYQWSPLYDNVTVGARNILLNSTFNDGFNHWDQAGVNYTALDPASDKPASGILQIVSASATSQKASDAFYVDGGVDYTISFDIKISALAAQSWLLFTLRLFTDPSIANSQANSIWHSNILTFQDITVANTWVRKTFTFNLPNSGYLRVIPYNASKQDANTAAITSWYREIKVEKGNVATDYSIAPEDLQALIDYKAAADDLNALGQIVTDLSNDLGGKADAGSLQSLTDDYNARMAQDVKDKAALSQSLSDLAGRTTLVETIAGNSKIVTDFVNTVITESDEGIYIANNASSTGILIASDRISFMSNNVEVAYISNQTMQINHGIFVQSATIANFKFEAIPGTKILAIQWVGG